MFLLLSQVSWVGMLETNLDYLAQIGQTAIIIKLFHRKESGGTRFSMFLCKNIPPNGEAVGHPWLIYPAWKHGMFCCNCKLLSFIYTLYHSNPLPSLRGALVGLAPQTKLQVPSDWNTIYQWSFGQFLECQAPPHKRKAPYWKLSDDGSAAINTSSLCRHCTRTSLLVREVPGQRGGINACYNSFIYWVLRRCPLKSLLERSWRHPFGPRLFNTTDFYHDFPPPSNLYTPLSGTPQKCF